MRAKKLGLLVVIAGSPLFLLGCPTGTINPPTFSASAGSPQFDGDGKLVLSGSGFAFNHIYDVGINSGGAARKIGTISTDGSGSFVSPNEPEYKCTGGVPPATGAGVYEVNGTNLGAGIAQTTIQGSTCM
jgi:hypothetical protein